MIKVCVIGLGYIGLPTASLLAKKGYKVLGVDINEKLIKSIQKGNVKTVEPDLKLLFQDAISSKNLITSNKPSYADIFIITVPSPIKRNKPDLSFIKSAAFLIAPYLKKNNLIILESTVPVGTTKIFANWIKEKRGFIDDLFFAHCPERVLPGAILKELVENDRIIGGLDNKASKKASKFYKSFIKGKVFETNAETAELTKLTENSFRDLNIAFANELSMLCDKLNVNVWNLIKFANCHPRVKILKPGAGVGGHCIAVDPYFIISSNKKDAKLIQTARKVNKNKTNWLLEKIIEEAKKLKKPKIGCLGLSYKNDVNDLRESPSLFIVKKLMTKKIAELFICEPNLKEKIYEKIPLKSLKETIQHSNIIVFFVRHKEFLKISKKDFKDKIIIDACGVLNEK